MCNAYGQSRIFGHVLHVPNWKIEWLDKRFIVHQTMKDEPSDDVCFLTEFKEAYKEFPYALLCKNSFTSL